MTGAAVLGAGPRVLKAGQRVARFELLRELGRGAQAAVWLAHDPLLDREVALKMLDVGSDGGNDSALLDEWLHEARAVSRLSHAHIVPVFEADADDGRPYLVFEFVDGPTLAQARRERPQWPPTEAVQLMLGVLDALALAHAQGIVHRDLKPSNVLLGHDGRPRVMDFGIAARVAAPGAAGDGLIVGTPGYMSPEAARGEPPQPTMDVFAAGVMLAELLGGAPLLRERDPWKALERVQREDLVLPATVRVDDTLRGIVQRALARDAGQRYDGARALRAALAFWLEPAAAPLPEASHGTLEFLLRRMRHKSDFPALSDSVLRIQRMAASESANTGALAEEILKDVALTNKLLRMVNSAHFTAAAGGAITTVSRAVSLVGFAGIRNMALAVLLLEHMHDKGHAAHLKDEFVRALMAGTLASELSAVQREGEEAFLGSMFQNLGRLLTEFYFPEEALQIRKQLHAAPDTHALREAAALRVLGIGLDELGAGVARAWGLPRDLQAAMRPPADPAPPRAPASGVERMRWLGQAANGLTDALLDPEPGAAAQRLQALAQQYGAVLNLSKSQIVGAAQSARGRLAQLTSAMGLKIPKGASTRRLLAAEAAPAGPDTPAAAPDPPPPAAAGAAPSAAEAALDAALVQVRRAQAGPNPMLNDLLTQVLAAMHGALGLRAIVLCLREPRSGQLQGRLALGALSAAVFRIDPRADGDLFAALCAKGADTLIADVRKVASRLPPWFRREVGGATFLLLPLMVKGAPIGLIYADRAQANSLQLSERQLAQLRALRDCLLAAFTRAA